jgi:hypothetical protein
MRPERFLYPSHSIPGASNPWTVALTDQTIAQAPNNDTDRAIGANLVATFTENVQAGTGFVTISETSDNSVVETFNVESSAQLGFSGSQLTINPTSNLQVGVEYHVQIDTTAVKNSVGTFFTGIADTTTWSFTTDSIAPTLASTTPADEATNVLISPFFPALRSSHELSQRPSPPKQIPSNMSRPATPHADAMAACWWRDYRAPHDFKLVTNLSSSARA